MDDEKQTLPVELLPSGSLTPEARTALTAAARSSDGPAPVPEALRALVAPRSAAKAYEAAFELIGGVSALALWADENRSEFYKLHSKLVPQSLQDGDGGPLRVLIASYAPQAEPPPPAVLPAATTMLPGAVEA